MIERPLDDIDRRLLDELRSNARTGHARLAEAVRLSRTAVRQRIDRLERDGYIRGYTIVEAVPASAALVSATLLVFRRDRMRGADVISMLTSISEVVHCDVVAGELDLVVRVEAVGPERVRQIWQTIAAHPGVLDMTTAMSMSTVIDRRG